MSNTDLELYTDASGSVSFGAYFQGAWCAERWPTSLVDKGCCSNLVLLELFPLVVALYVWGDGLMDNLVLFLCDNLEVVHAVNRQTASSPPVVQLLRRFVLQCLLLNAYCMAVSNCIADSVSHFQWDRFQELAPVADDEGIRFPDYLWQLV